MAFEFTDGNFEETVLESKGLKVVDFWAEWCGPCKAIAPIVDELATKYEGQATIGKLNVDHNGNTSFKYKVRSIPTILFFKDGEPVDKIVGAPSKMQLEEKIKEHLSAGEADSDDADSGEVPVAVSSDPVEFTDDNFDNLVTNAKGVQVVDFWAEWCGPCKMLTPAIKELATDYAGKATVGKLDIEANPSTTFKYKVRNIPTILILKDGEVVDKQVGVTTKSALADKINAHLS